MGLLHYCGQCGHAIDWKTPPPWCPRCGADFKPRGNDPGEEEPGLEAADVPPPPPSEEPAAATPGPPTVLGVPLWPTSSHSWWFLLGLTALVAGRLLVPILLRP